MRPRRFHRASIRCALLLLLLACANPVNAQFGTASITLQPVAPKTVPPSDYPPGSTIVGQEIILGSVPARVWLEIHYTGWAPEILKTIQVTISATDSEMDGGGYLGTNADCNGDPAIGAGNLIPAMQPCNVNADCRSTMSGLDSPCGVGEPSRCLLNDETSGGNNFPYFPHGPGVRFCEPGFQDRCDPAWGALGIAALSAVDISSHDYRFGITAEPDETPPDFHPSYAGTLVIDVPSNAKGSYMIDFDETQTFLQNPNNPPKNNPTIPRLFSATITVPCGRCCFGIGSENPQCVDDVSANECASYIPSAVFYASEVCPQAGGSDCPVCTLDEHCDDGVFCNGLEVCDISGQCAPSASPCRETDVCHEDQARCAPRIPAINVWGIIMMTTLLLIAGKLRFRGLPRSATRMLLTMAFCCVPISLFAQNGGVSVTLQPVAPKTVPPSDYPPGTTIVGQEINLGSVPARVWLEIHVTGWAPETLRVVQAAISVYDWDMDGGGFSGANAVCFGEPVVGAGNLSFAMQPCGGSCSTDGRICHTNSECRFCNGGTNAGNPCALATDCPGGSCPAATGINCINPNGACRAAFAGLTSPCSLGEPSRCGAYDGRGAFPSNDFCEPWFIDKCDAQWLGTGIQAITAIDVDFYAYGLYAESGIPQDFHPSYIGTLVVDVPANAKGTYTIDFDETQTFLQNPNNPPDDDLLPIAFLLPARITVPCGRCCYGVGTGNTQCVEAVSANECATYTSSAVFQAAETCPDSGGSACPVCALDEHCDDGVFCNGAEVCDASGVCGPGEPPCDANEACEEDTDSCAPRIPTINEWGMLMMAILFLIASKLRYRQIAATTFGRFH